MASYVYDFLAPKFTSLASFPALATALRRRDVARAREFHYQLTTIPPLLLAGEAVSSSLLSPTFSTLSKYLYALFLIHSRALFFRLLAPRSQHV